MGVNRALITLLGPSIQELEGNSGRIPADWPHSQGKHCAKSARFYAWLRLPGCRGCV